MPGIFGCALGRLYGPFFGSDGYGEGPTSSLFRPLNRQWFVARVDGAITGGGECGGYW